MIRASLVVLVFAAAAVAILALTGDAGRVVREAGGERDAARRAGLGQALQGLQFRRGRRDGAEAGEFLTERRGALGGLHDHRGG